MPTSSPSRHPGKTSGEVHDRLCKQNEGKPVVTIGFGPDFAVLRSKGVHMNIPRMVRDLHNEIPGGGISGGGHLVVGSIKFVEGMREVVLEALIKKSWRCTGTAIRPYLFFFPRKHALIPQNRENGDNL